MLGSREIPVFFFPKWGKGVPIKRMGYVVPPRRGVKFFTGLVLKKGAFREGPIGG